MEKIELIDNFKPRLYQQTIFSSSIFKNSFVVLPTGLGKTIIALLLSVFYYNKFNKKILFLAPTKPLVNQQKNSFEKFIKNSKSFELVVLTGQTSPKKREEIYKENDFIFSTPQVIENDILSKTINLDDFCFCIFDEAHRATKNYSYCFIAEQLNNTKNLYNLCLSASPGSKKEDIEEVFSNLFINHIEIKKNEDSDILPYINKTEISRLEVELCKDSNEIKNLFDKVLKNRIDKLKEYNFISQNSKLVTKTELLNLSAFLRARLSQQKDTSFFEGISITSGIMKLIHGIEIFETQNFKLSFEYFLGFFKRNETKAVLQISGDVYFREAIDKLKILVDKKINHPKINELKEIVKKNLEKNKDLKIIIFSSFRDVAKNLEESLNKISNVKSSIFVGQAKKNNINFSQKKQKQIIEDFRDGKINVLISTSVGEEGLDIPQVDLVVFYEPISSAIRTIQRVGRTGRFSKGEVLVLITKNTKDEINLYVSNRKEKRMYLDLQKIKKKIEKDFGDDKNKSLNSFIKKNDFLREEKQNNEKEKMIKISNKDFSELKKNLKFDLK